ncbi:L-lysine 2,3-aminomutase (KAM) (LAM) [Sulfurihydrogenibium azorense Az-Fu1]|uniref:L-lysine 2,3-aminomutase (KAM) (LAM) n=1 Tax=Sulfurihydrogenibium azorense (strain DSM 15241 / OCM 825 / Az-Fu1) TaxID=204536 RepID=C1DXE9_SULAA|nr:KamA family radical SAM protein [Sulfurihydrogenibium azorense]ACN98822.1 L-lysine 2,3-aminomutase (KAM) (LAM) [Sulfurihydrogenibium azorense Az-Fu1]
MRVLEGEYWKEIPLYSEISQYQWKDWKWQIKNRLKTLEDIKKILPNVNEDVFKKVSQIYHFGTTPYYIFLADRTNLEDPILKQILPDEKEIDEKYQEGAFLDPFLEDEKSPVLGLTHRYPDRVLFRATNFCSVYCRHCMRKRMFLEDERARTKQEYDVMFEYIKSNKAIKEVLVSGGDPLTLPNQKIEYIIKNLYEIDHVDIIRIGSRELVSNPFRFYDEELLEIFEKYDKVWIVTHFNHPNEITSETKKAVKNILSTGTPVLNQTVLLKGINDDKYTMENLMRSLLKVKIKPYYLFHCDPTKGVYHFKTGIEKGLEIMEHLRGRVSGLGNPTFAVDLVNGLGKVPLLPEYLISKKNGFYEFKNYQGKTVKIKI